MSMIRLAAVSDAAGIAAVYAPYCERTAVSFEMTAPSAEDMARRISDVGSERPWLVLEDAGAVVGYAYAGSHNERAAYRWTVSTAIYVSEGHRRRGVGRALYTTLFELLRHLGYVRATAGITLPNAASVGLHEAFGFTLVGVYRDVGYKLGAWHDVAWYEAGIQPIVREPEAPRPIAALNDAPELATAVAKGLAHHVDHS